MNNNDWFVKVKSDLVTLRNIGVITDKILTNFVSEITPYSHAGLELCYWDGKKPIDRILKIYDLIDKDQILVAEIGIVNNIRKVFFELYGSGRIEITGVYLDSLEYSEYLKFNNLAGNVEKTRNINLLDSANGLVWLTETKFPFSYDVVLAHSTYKEENLMGKFLKECFNYNPSILIATNKLIEILTIKNSKTLTVESSGYGIDYYKFKGTYLTNGYQSSRVIAWHRSVKRDTFDSLNNYFITRAFKWLHNDVEKSRF